LIPSTENEKEVKLGDEKEQGDMLKKKFDIMIEIVKREIETVSDYNRD